MTKRKATSQRQYTHPSDGFRVFYRSLTDGHKKILRATVAKSKQQRDGASECIFSLLKDVDNPRAPTHKRGNPRIGIPSEVLKALPSSVNRAKKPISWVVCAVHDILPPTGRQTECSHVCVNDDCINPAHLHWESRSINQSRGAKGTDGNRICTRPCSHASCTSINICECSGIHQPHCV